MGKRTSLCVPRNFDGVLKGQDAGGQDLPAVGLTSEAPFSVLIWVLGKSGPNTCKHAPRVGCLLPRQGFRA